MPFFASFVWPSWVAGYWRDLLGTILDTSNSGGVVNALTYLRNDGIENTPTAVAKLVARLTELGSTSEFAAFPSATARALYFPSGLYLFPANTQITTWGTGVTIYGDGFSSQVQHLGFNLIHDSTGISNLLMRGDTSDEYGIKLADSDRAGSFISRVQIRGYTTNLLDEAGQLDQIDQCVFIAAVEDNLRVIGNNAGQNFTDCIFRAAGRDNININPAAGQAVNQLKFSNCVCTAPTRHGLHLEVASDNETIVECYFNQHTFSGSVARTVAITSAADAGGGLVRFTTADPHLLLPTMRDVTISGTTDYNGVFTIMDVTDATHFDVTDTFVSTQTGTMSVAGWDVYAELNGSARQAINDIWFTGGNGNYWYLSGYNFNFGGAIRLKQEVYLVDVSQFWFWRQTRGRAGATAGGLWEVPIGGPGAATGWGEVACLTGDPSNFAPGNSSTIIRSPNAASGLTGMMPAAFNSLEVSETGVTVTVAGVDVTPW